MSQLTKKVSGGRTHSSKPMTTMDPIMAVNLAPPDLDTTKSPPDKAETERERIRSGQLHGLAWLVLFSPSEDSPWSLIRANELKFIPAGVAHYTKMGACDRTEQRALHSKDGKSWQSCIFARAELGKIQVNCM